MGLYGTVNFHQALWKAGRYTRETELWPLCMLQSKLSPGTLYTCTVLCCICIQVGDVYVCSYVSAHVWRLEVYVECLP